MTRSGNLVIALVVCIVVAVALALVPSSAAVTCSDVKILMVPCIQYLTSAGAKPSGKCCEGVRNLVTAASTPLDRRTACSCLKSAAENIKNIIPNKAAALPAQCHANIKYKISPDTDCNKIN